MECVCVELLVAFRSVCVVTWSDLYSNVERMCSHLAVHVTERAAPRRREPHCCLPYSWILAVVIWSVCVVICVLIWILCVVIRSNLCSNLAVNGTERAAPRRREPHWCASTLTPTPETPIPKPENLISKPQTPNPNLQAPNPKP